MATDWIENTDGTWKRIVTTEKVVKTTLDELKQKKQHLNDLIKTLSDRIDGLKSEVSEIDESINYIKNLK